MLRGKTIIITGASSGIGQTIAVECSRLGARVILVGRDQRRLEQTLDLFSDKTAGIALTCDLTDYNSVTKICSELRQHYRLDGIVHAAGISKTLPFKLQTPEILIETFKTNLFGLGLLISGLWDNLNKGGRIVVISSVMSVVGMPAKLSYCASKGALDAYVRSLALELADRQIRVNSILPGVVRTPLQESLFSKLPDGTITEIEQSFPLGMGFPGDVTEAVVYLLSDQSGFLTGAQIITDGGYSSK